MLIAQQVRAIETVGDKTADAEAIRNRVDVIVPGHHFSFTIVGGGVGVCLHTEYLPAQLVRQPQDV